MRGTTAGAVVLLGLLGANAANAVFHLVAARSLGPSRYGDLATLVAIVGLLAFPLGGVQFAVAQRIAQSAARHDSRSISTLYRRALAWAFVVGTILSIAMAVLSEPIQRALRVGSVAAVLLTAATLLPTVISPVVAGLAQGLERFVLFSASQVIAPVTRIALLLPLIELSMGVPGAMGATFVATALAVAGTAWVLRIWVAKPRQVAVSIERRPPIRRALIVSVTGILALTALTTLDVVVAKVSLSSKEAGLYGAASLVGRLILFLPTAVASVLLPKVSSRAATGRDASRLVLPSLLITALLCLLLTAVYALAPTVLIRLSFGAKYEDAAPWLWLFGVEMTCFALANVAFAYDLGRDRARGAWLMAAAAIAELLGYIAFHDTPRHLLAVNIGTGVLLLVVYAFVGLLGRASGVREAGYRA